jgi:hypothetical protein
VIGASGYKTFNVTIDSGVFISSNSTSSPALTTGSGWPSGAVLTITNNGTIAGKGGDGGDYSATSPGNGTAGGDAIVFTIDATLVNNGTISGGGGGGGGGNTTGTRTVDKDQEEQESQP